jgi:hypothetical protein
MHYCSCKVKEKPEERRRLTFILKKMETLLQKNTVYALKIPI